MKMLQNFVLTSVVTVLAVAAHAVEMVQLAKLHLARGEAREAIHWASRLDHSQSFSYLPFIAESLSVRYRAAQALGDSALAETYRERLLGLGREDLIEGE